MQFADFLNQLNLMLGDVNNFALTIDEKTQNLTNALKDQYVVKQVWDNSLVFSISQYQYPIPATVSVVDDIYLERTSDQFPDPIDANLWEQIAGNIQFKTAAQWKIPDQYPIWMRGKYKFTVSDTINDEALQNYILALAGWISLRNLAYTKLLSFVRNNSTINDMLNMRKEMKNDVMEYRAQLATSFVPN